MAPIRFFLSGICHQIPSHCLHYEGQPLPLCARCMGTFCGAIIALLILWATGRGRRGGMPSRGPALVLIGLSSAWALDGLNSVAAQVLGQGPLYPPTNLLRLISGAGFGVALGSVLYPVINMALWPEPDQRAVIAGARGLLPALAAGYGLVLVALIWSSAPYALWAATGAFSTAMLLSLVNGLLVAMVTHEAGFLRRPYQVLPYLALGFVLSLLEAGSVAALRGLLLAQVAVR